ncbi:MAG TPA: MBL fold metallo-hydrolase [Beijerinckiaceae bacterium]|jgi:ribonuclease BN (tRNA processing enzyme)
MDHVEGDAPAAAERPGRDRVAGSLRLTVVGCGDAFGTGGRAHTCFRLDAGGRCLLVDFGASSILGWRKLGFSTDDVDAVVVSHLHGDHFGGLPFLLLDCQYVAQRRKPLVLAGPPGFAARLEAACEVFFPGMSRNAWTFPLEVREIEPGSAAELVGFDILTLPVRHPSGAPATGVRVAAAGRVFAYSGDTSWTDALEDLARDADLFVCECSGGEKPVPHHLDWPSLEPRLARLRARAVMLTHLGPTALGRRAAMERAGARVAEDGASLAL